MRNFHGWFIALVLIAALHCPPLLAAPPAATTTETEQAPAVTLHPEVGKSLVEQAEKVKADFVKQAQSLFYRTPLGWDLQTIRDLYHWIIGLPLQVPHLAQKIMEQGRLLGVAGSLLVLTFIGAVVYSLIGRKKVLARMLAALTPFEKKLPAALFPFFVSLMKVLAAALLPLLLLAVFSLIDAFIKFQAVWFQLTGKFLGLWAAGALIIGVLREVLTGSLFPRTAVYGKRVFAVARLVVFFILAGMAGIWLIEGFQIRADIVALLKFVISVSIVIVSFLLLMMKKTLLSLLPDLPDRFYQGFVRMMVRFFYPFIIFSFVVALLWCLGYRQFGKVILLKTWSTLGAYLLIMWAFNLLRGWLARWYAGKDYRDETAAFLFRSLKTVLLYATVTVTVVIILNMLGFLDPLQRLMSFPVITLGKAPITLWLILKAVLILLAFVFVSRLLRAYLDYRVYPSLGIDSGLGYALNISLNYLLIAIGLLISLKAIGLDLRFLLVFAGAAGIGIGLGLQHMAANVISGFSLIFGGKVRKGDWIEVSDTLGYVTDIFLNATRIRTRDNIEYLIPNSSFVSNTIVNYSLTSALIRVAIPVGVSYDANPRTVEKILLEVAVKEPMVTDYKAPLVRLVEYGDSSINFQLLVWIDVRETPRRKLRSSLYFAIYDEFKNAGIEIPFPQRDLHIRSSNLKQLTL
ncbi:MAG: mechanosensitive ion channel domain-containing protein [Desulfobacterales bacterium]